MSEFDDFRTKIKNINNYINNWVSDIGYPQCHVYFGQVFSYDYINNIITYSFDEPEYEDDIYLNVCQQYKPSIIQCDNFIISLLHEIGHCATDVERTLDEWFEYNELIRKFEEKDPTPDDYVEYYMSEVEYTATKWACDFLLNNKDKVNELMCGLKIISPSFYQWKDLILQD